MTPRTVPLRLAAALGSLIVVSLIAAPTAAAHPHPAPPVAAYTFSHVQVTAASGAPATAFEVTGIANDGTIAGAVLDPERQNSATGQADAFIRHPDGTTTLVDFHNAGATTAAGMANDGFALLLEFRNSNIGRPLRSYLRGPDGGLSRIAFPHAGYTEALAVNDSGEVVGDYVAQHRFHPFVDSNGSYAPFEIPGRHTREVDLYGVNDNGVIVGDYVDKQHVLHGFIDRNGTFTFVNLPGAGREYGGGSLVAGIADNGGWIGLAIPDRGGSTGYVHRSGQPLARLAVPANERIVVDPVQMNDDGVIVGVTFNTATFEENGFVATPKG